jgi:hypothetical protein
MRRRDRPAVGRIDPALITALKRWMHRNECAAFKDLEFIGQDVNIQDAPAGCLRNAVEITADADEALMRDAPFELEDGTVGRQRQRLQERLLLGKGLVDDALCDGMDPRVRDRVEPMPELLIEVVEIAERATEEEVLTDVAEGALDLAVIRHDGFGALTSR